jgi:MFS family permease
MVQAVEVVPRWHGPVQAVVWCIVSLNFGIQASIVGPTASILAQQAHTTEDALAPGAWLMLHGCAVAYAHVVCASSSTLASSSLFCAVLGMGGLCTLLSGIPSGWLIDHVPGSVLLAVSLALQAAGFALMPACPSIAWLVLVYGSIGLTFNVVNTGVGPSFCACVPRPIALVLARTSTCQNMFNRTCTNDHKCTPWPRTGHD